MNVTVLGKYGPYPKAGGAASGYLLSAGGNRILLDCGSGVFSRLISLCPPEELSAVLLTHLHADHSSDLGVMNYYLQRLGRELDVFLPVDAVRFSAIEGMKGFRFHPVREGDRIAVGGAEIAFYGMRHPVPALGIRVSAEGRVFAYTGDTNDFEGLSLFWKGADTVLADAAFLEKDWSGGKAASFRTALCALCRRGWGALSPDAYQPRLFRRRNPKRGVFISASRNRGGR